MSDAVTIESRGIPTIVVGHTHFEYAAQVHAKAKGCEELPLLMHDPPEGGMVGDEVEATDEQVRAVVAGLTTAP